MVAVRFLSRPSSTRPVIPAVRWQRPVGETAGLGRFAEPGTGCKATWARQLVRNWRCAASVMHGVYSPIDGDGRIESQASTGEQSRVMTERASYAKEQDHHVPTERQQTNSKLHEKLRPDESCVWQAGLTTFKLIAGWSLGKWALCHRVLDDPIACKRAIMAQGSVRCRLAHCSRP